MINLIETRFRLSFAYECRRGVKTKSRSLLHWMGLKEGLMRPCFGIFNASCTEAFQKATHQGIAGLTVFEIRLPRLEPMSHQRK